jgi:hypothetical protein
MAVKKLGLVYERAEHVLVLDASLMSYNFRNLDVAEQIVRVFTSSWTRRLWTLQEGAIARSLYFQFANQSLSSRALNERTAMMTFQMRYSSYFISMP